MDIIKALKLLLSTTASSQTLVVYSNVAVWSHGMISEQSVSNRGFDLDGVCYTRICRSRYIEGYEGPKTNCQHPRVH